MLEKFSNRRGFLITLVCCFFFQMLGGCSSAERAKNDKENEDSDPPDDSDVPTVYDSVPKADDVVGYGVGCSYDDGTRCLWKLLGYFVDATSAEIDLVSTGDSGFSCGPGKDIVCGVWHEHHELYSSGDKMTLELAVVETASEQVDNLSTLMNSSEELNSISVLLEIFDSEGVRLDCWIGGENSDYYSGECAG